MVNQNTSRWMYAVAALFFLLVLPAFWVDFGIARWIKENQIGGDLRRLVNLSEVFAFGWGVLVLIITVFCLDTQRRWQVPRLLAMAFLPGVMANGAKQLVARIRPSRFDLDQSVWETFVGWLPTIHGLPTGLENGYGVQSFPSGHTATAVGFALGLARIYPRGKWLFAVFATMAAFQRIQSSAHYLSDTLAGAAIGFLAAAIVADPILLGRWFDPLERRWQRRVASTSVNVLDSRRSD